MEKRNIKNTKKLRHELEKWHDDDEFIDTIVEMFEDGLIKATYNNVGVYISLTEKGEKVVSGKGLNRFRSLL